MKFWLILGLSIGGLFWFSALPAHGQEPAEQPIADILPVEEYFLGEVIEIVEEQEFEAQGFLQLQQIVRVRLLSGPQKDQTLEIDNSSFFVQGREQRLTVGEKVVVGLTQTGLGETYFIADKYRLPSLGWIFGGFAALVLLFSGLRGFGSLLGMILSLVVLTLYTVPKILEGQNPLAVSILSAGFIALISIYLAHGFKKRTSVALFSTFITLGLATALAAGFVAAARLFGIGTEEAFYLQLLQGNAVSLKGLLLGGIIIGALGVLDDVTTTQTAAVDEIARANPALKFGDLYRRGLSVGREHIAALVNTLVLAYAGASLPLFLLFTINERLPIWVTLNSEFVAEEVVRTLVGSTALVLAVPISTLLAAYFLKKQARTT